MPSMISYEDECWLKLSLVKSLDVPTLLAAIRKTGSVEEFLDSRLSALSTLVGLEAARFKKLKLRMRLSSGRRGS